MEATYQDRVKEIEASHAKMMAKAQQEEAARIDFENRCAAAARLFDAEYRQPDFHAITAPIVALIERAMRGADSWSELRPPFVEAYNAAKAAVAPCERFFHQSFIDEWVAWLRQADHVFGRVGQALNAVTRESYSAEFSVVKSRVGWFATKTAKGAGEHLNDHIALAQTLPREDLTPYMAQAAAV